jgi:hypothetical protein
MKRIKNLLGEGASGKGSANVNQDKSVTTCPFILQCGRDATLAAMRRSGDLTD